MEVPRFASVGLSLMLAANCFMPCYTLAYADESTDGGAIYEQLREDQQERAGDGQADKGPNFQGVLRHEAAEEASPCSELLPAAGAGRVYPSAHVLVEASYSLADSLIRLSSARAYADESQEIEYVSQEEQEEIAGDAGGLEYPSGVGESNADAADGGAAAERHGDYLGTSEEAGEDSSGLDGGLDGDGNFFERVLTSLEDITYLLGELADYQRQNGSGVSPHALTDDYLYSIKANTSDTNTKLNSVITYINDLEAYTTRIREYTLNSLNELADINKKTSVLRGNSSESGRINWTLNGNVWNTNSTGLAWLLSYILMDVSSINAYTAQINQKSTYMESLYSLVGKQWGVGFGGTIVSYNNSPYRFLQNLNDRTYFMRGSSSESGYVNWSFRSNNWATPSTGLPWLLSFIAEILNGTNNNVIGIGNDLSASYVLDGETYSNKSVAQILAHLINVQYWEAFDIKRIKENTSALSTSMQLTGLPAGESTIAQIARYIHNNMVSSYVIDGETYSNKSVAQMLSQVVNSSYWTSDKQSKIYDAFNALTLGPEGGRVSLYNIGNSIETIKNETRDLDNLLEDSNTWLDSIHDRLTALDALGVRFANIALTADEIKKGVNSSLQWYETLHGDLSMLRHGAADLLPGYADWTVWDFLQGIYFDMGNVVDLLKGLQQTLTAWGSRWDSQDLYLMEWAKRWDALDKGASWSESDKGALFAKLDGISDRLSVEAGKAVLDTILGDMSLDATGAASAAVGSAIQNAFPFCVPAVLKQILGLLQADPAPPEFHFDFWGAPLDFGFSDWQGLADMTSWLSRIGFAVMLFANSRRFVYSGGVAGD